MSIQALADYLGACEDSSIVGNVAAIRRGEEAMAKMHVSGGEALLMSRLTAPDSQDLPRKLHLCMTAFSKNLIDVADFHPAIMLQFRAVVSGRRASA